MDWLPDNIMEIVLGFIGLASFLYSAWRLVVRRLFLNLRLARMERRLSARPVALAIGIGKDIKGAVRHYLNDKQLLIPLESYHWAPPPMSNFVHKGDFPEIIREMEAIKQRMMNQGVTELYLFYSGPVTLAQALGVVFRNFVPIKTYNYVKNGYDLELIIERDGSIFQG